MIIRLALANNPKGWEEGTVCSIHEDSFAAGWKEKSNWLLIRVPTPFMGGVERLKTKISLDFLSAQDISDYRANRNFTNKADFDNNGKKPDLVTVITNPTVLPTDQSQWPPDAPVPTGGG